MDEEEVVNRRPARTGCYSFEKTTFFVAFVTLCQLADVLWFSTSDYLVFLGYFFTALLVEPFIKLVVGRREELSERAVKRQTRVLTRKVTEKLANMERGGATWRREEWLEIVSPLQDLLIFTNEQKITLASDNYFTGMFSELVYTILWLTVLTSCLDWWGGLFLLVYKVYYCLFLAKEIIRPSAQKLKLLKDKIAPYLDEEDPLYQLYKMIPIHECLHLVADAVTFVAFMLFPMGPMSLFAVLLSPRESEWWQLALVVLTVVAGGLVVFNASVRERALDVLAFEDRLLQAHLLSRFRTADPEAFVAADVCLMCGQVRGPSDQLLDVGCSKCTWEARTMFYKECPTLDCENALSGWSGRDLTCADCGETVEMMNATHIILEHLVKRKLCIKYGECGIGQQVFTIDQVGTEVWVDVCGERRGIRIPKPNRNPARLFCKGDDIISASESDDEETAKEEDDMPPLVPAKESTSPEEDDMPPLVPAKESTSPADPSEGATTSTAGDTPNAGATTETPWWQPLLASVVQNVNSGVRAVGVHGLHFVSDAMVHQGDYNDLVWEHLLENEHIMNFQSRVAFLMQMPIHAIHLMIGKNATIFVYWTLFYILNYIFPGNIFVTLWLCVQMLRLVLFVWQIRKLYTDIHVYFDARPILKSYVAMLTKIFKRPVGYIYSYAILFAIFLWKQWDYWRVYRGDYYFFGLGFLIVLLKVSLTHNAETAMYILGASGVLTLARLYSQELNSNTIVLAVAGALFVVLEYTPVGGKLNQLWMGVEDALCRDHRDWGALVVLCAFFAVLVASHLNATGGLPGLPDLPFAAVFATVGA